MTKPNLTASPRSRPHCPGDPGRRALVFAVWLEAKAGRAPIVTISAKFAYELAAMLVQLHAERAA